MLVVVALLATTVADCGRAAFVQTVCAEVCTCSREDGDAPRSQAVLVNCSGLDLTFVPSTKLKYDAWYATSIDLSNNLITRIDRNAFHGQKLARLKLDQNDIEEVDAAAFNVTSFGWPLVRSSPLQFLSLRGNSLHSIPKAFSTADKSMAVLDNLSTLSLAGNPFGKNIHSDSFVGVGQVTHLDLAKCMLTTLPGLIFKDMDNLVELDLSFNSLSSIPQTAFGRNWDLTVLKLDGNLFARIPRRLPRNVRELRMSSNRIRNLTDEDRRSLARLRKLEILDLSGNQLRLHPFASFATLARLKFLDLSRNSVDRVALTSFAGLADLRYLFLNDNPYLTTFERGTLEPLASLRYLFLHRCSLSKVFVSPTAPGARSLRHLWLHGNPINCNCEVAPFVRMLRASQIRLDADVPFLDVREQDKKLEVAVASKLAFFGAGASPTVCAGPSNRLRKVVGRTIANVPEDYLTCPDEPIYVIVSVFLGIFLFAAAIPVVFCMIGLYLLLVRFAKTQLGWKFEDGED